MENKDSTRYYSNKHEKSVIKALGGRQTSNSGANRFEKGDVIIDKAYMLCECKCSMSPKKSFSVKKEWFLKLREEAFRNRLHNTALCFNFEPNGDNYYIIDENLMQYFIDKLSDED